VSTTTNKTGKGGTKTNSKGEPHCFNYGATSHWAYECPQLSREQQAQLHMNLHSREEEQAQEQAREEGHQMLHVSMTQGGDLPDDQAYLNGCSTVTAFKNDKFLSRLPAVAAGIKITCNAGPAVTNMKGKFGRLNAWYLSDKIANILSMHKLEKMYRITYDSWEGFYVDGLPYINLTKSRLEAARMLMQVSKDTKKEELCEVETGLSCLQTVCGNYEGFTRQETLQAKEA
jgi:hypothetical protein